ncbi:MAG: hypothetical protein ACXVB1_00175 [Pseudobdellovibrionaceae bacterium]
MKKSWTKLYSILKHKNSKTSDANIETKFNRLFLSHHKNSCEIILNSKGEPLAAIYFTPTGSHQEEFKHLMKMVRDRTQYAHERDEDEL